MDVIIPESHLHLFGPNSLLRQVGIYTIPNKILFKVAEPVEKFDKNLKKLIRRMKIILKQTHGIGLAAPQIGESLRVILLGTNNKSPTVVVNPVLSYKSEHMVETTEGCLSVPGLYGVVSRHATVKLDGFDISGKPLSLLLGGMESVVAQHEIDHLNGELFYDKAIITTLDWSL